ncbi:Spy/CpxP family protein refolding chaperone [Aphanothece hegewaldii]|nr:Spy/CpxP family protein refolding chaperone [Aphanothece hegewaldii]
MFKHSIIASLSMLTLVVGSSSVVAYPQFESNSLLTQKYAQAGGSPQRSRRHTDVFEQLNLTEPQKQQISSIRLKYRDRMEQTSSKIRSTQQELQKLMASNASRNDIRAKHAQVGDLRQELDNLRFESMLDIRDVLTITQRQQLDQLMEQRRTRMDKPPQPPAAM